jgi:protein-disulfide isomerase
MSDIPPVENTGITESVISPEEEVQEPANKRRLRILKDGDTLVIKRSHLYMALLPLTFVVGLSVGYLFWGRPNPAESSTAVAQVDQPQVTQEQAVQRYDVPEAGNPSLGNPDAPITLIEFSDYECPYCKRWYKEVFHQVRKDYPDQVRIVFRDFPLSSIHPDAIAAAEAANCANEQGSYWEYHDLLFSGDELNDAVYLKYAGDLGLDVDKFKECLDSDRQLKEVMDDYNYASGLGVRSTPTFFLNGLPLVGAQPYEVFKQVIDQELAGKIP